jgi:hypothetical protein
MGRKLKPLPATALAAKPKRNVAEQEARRTFIWNLILAGADTRTIRSQVLDKYHVGKGTIEDDVRLLRAEASRHYEEQRKDMLAVSIQKLDRIALELRQTAREAGEAGERAVKVSALAAARQTEKDIMQIAGLVVQKQEVTGVIGNLNLNVEATPADIAAFRKALENAGTSL